ncbi:MAG: TrmH family RNA methyltransferase [Bulleidia sp.]
MMILEGKVSVKAAMLGNHRKVNRILIDERKHDKDTHFIEQKAKALGIETLRKPREELDAMASGFTHGGILAEAEERQYQNLSDCLQKENPFLVLLEGVEDPYNLGYVMRSLYSAGCDGLLLEKRDWSRSEPVIVKASAGASEYLNTVCSEEPSELIHACREKGLKIYAAMRRDAIPYFEADFRIPIVLCIGGEMRGLSSAVLKEADQNIYIPYANDFRNALNAAGASAALSFEILRQRQYG